MNRHCWLMVIGGLCLAGVVGAAAPATAPTTGPSDGVLAASRVTLRLKQADPKAVFAELGRQSGRELRPYPPQLWQSRRWPAMDLELTDVSFWAAMKQICRRCDISVQRLGMQRELSISADSSTAFWRFPSIEYGPFLLVATEIERSDQIDLTISPKAKRRCLVRLRLYAEPKVPLLKAAALALVDQAVDDANHSLVEKPAVDSQLAEANGEVWAATAELVPPDGASRRIAHLKGRLRLVVQTKAQLVEVDNILSARGATRDVAGRRLTVLEVNNDAEVYSVRLRIARTTDSSVDWSDINLNSTFRLVDAQGRPLTRRIQAGSDVADHLELNLAFGREDWAGSEGAGKAAKLIWEAPVETREILVPFDFTDLVMP